MASDRELLFRMALAGGREEVLDRVLYRYCEQAGLLTIRGGAAVVWKRL